MGKSGIIKNFVIDTNVLLFDPEAIFCLEDNNIIIPDVVLEELDHFKSEQSDRGYNCRKVSKYLDDLNNKGSLQKGVSLGENKGILTIGFTNDIKQSKYDISKCDNKILALCKNLLDSKKEHVILITKDVLLRVKAGTIGIIAQDYLNDKVEKTGKEYYTGRQKVFINSKDINEFKKNKKIAIKDIKFWDKNGKNIKIKLEINEFVEIYSADTNDKSVLPGRFDGKDIVTLKYSNSLKHIKTRNIGQQFMLECLMQPPDVAPLVVIKGIAGTAKTFFALAVALQKYKQTKDDQYNRVLVCRPSVCMDEEIGALPGGEQEKIAPYMRAIKDNIFSIYNGDEIMHFRDYKAAIDEVENLFKDEIIKTESLAFIRGRSLKNHWFVLDEMQNSTKKQVKGIITRGGIGTKIVLLGDPDQIDSPYLYKDTNGLTHASEKMKGSPLCWQVTMLDSECERSPLALEAAQKL